VIKEIQYKEPIHDVIISGYKNKIRYQTDDGKVYDDQKDAIRHQNNLDYNKKLNSIKSIKFNNVWYYENYWQWYYPQNKEELEFIKNHLNANDAEIYGELKINEWISGYSSDGGDHLDSYYITTLDVVKNDINNFINQLK
jgi:hypothetical protein